AAARIGERFRDQPLVEAEIRLTIGKAYNSLGEWEAAVAQLKRAVTLREMHQGPDHRDTLLAVHNLADAYQNAGRLDEALALYAQWLERFKAVFGNDSREAALYLSDLARISYKAGKLDDAERFMQAVLAIYRRISPPTHRPNVMYSLSWLSRIHLRQKRYA